jgi:hypothetical protein
MIKLCRFDLSKTKSFVVVSSSALISACAHQQARSTVSSLPAPGDCVYLGKVAGFAAEETETSAKRTALDRLAAQGDRLGGSYVQLTDKKSDFSASEVDVIRIRVEGQAYRCPPAEADASASASAAAPPPAAVPVDDGGNRNASMPRPELESFDNDGDPVPLPSADAGVPPGDPVDTPASHQALP